MLQRHASRVILSMIWFNISGKRHTCLHRKPLGFRRRMVHRLSRKTTWTPTSHVHEQGDIRQTNTSTHTTLTAPGERTHTTKTLPSTKEITSMYADAHQQNNVYRPPPTRPPTLSSTIYPKTGA
ncbi:unnamed protein product [Ectocarpus sp. 13 AM-2016]